ncbi:FAD-dependent oxidoreductase (plasmid) [Rhodococcus qingshengii]|uniref:flavin monoamine oxidase family protein n=1 Tax=Rhodococcus qingshengii TaxID=334542 RepID=UPI00211310F6|nr:NAD(P)/FAD-dependent oxidoreductase [Rhodococcus qingshengii]UUE28679.1 FAD-dependent oxidoreductase [Rhodococcus qingshengii]
MRDFTQGEVRREFDEGFPGVTGTQRITVVGAGLAGLGAAYELVRRGYEVTVLEARNRPGGRAYTLRSPFVDGLFAEAGAMTVTPGCHYTRHYLTEFNLALDQSDLVDTQFGFYTGSRYVGSDASSISEADLGLNDEEKGLGAWDLRDRYVREFYTELMPDIAQDSWEPSERIRPFDQMTVWDALKGRGASDAAIGLLEPLFNEMTGGELRACSALSWLRLESGSHALGNSQGWAKIKGGTDMLPRAFATRLSGLIHYGKPVVGIEQNETGVRTTYLDGGRPMTILSDRLVLAVPFSAVRRIDLSRAALSAEKDASIRRLRYMSIVRVYLQMRKQFWDGTNIALSTDLPIKWVRDATPHQAGPRKILEAYVTGWRARMLSAMSEEERVQFVLDQIESVLPGARENFEVGTSVVWDTERYNEGGFILPEVGHSDLMPTIRQPEGRIHFAGEHAGYEPNGGAMTFALESAARTVLEIASTEVAA